MTGNKSFQCKRTAAAVTDTTIKELLTIICTRETCLILGHITDF